MRNNCKFIFGLLALLLFAPASLRAQDKQVTGSIWYFEEYSGGQICRIPAAHVDAVKHIIGTNFRGTNGTIISALGDLVKKEDDIEMFDAHAEFALPLKRDTRMVLIFLTGNAKHSTFYQVDVVPVVRKADENDLGSDIIVVPPHKGAKLPVQAHQTDRESSSPPYAIPVRGHPDLVWSPYVRDKYVDISGFAPGAEVTDPYSGKTFLVPRTR